MKTSDFSLLIQYLQNNPRGLFGSLELNQLEETDRIENKNGELFVNYHYKFKNKEIDISPDPSSGSGFSSSSSSSSSFSSNISSNCKPSNSDLTKSTNLTLKKDINTSKVSIVASSFGFTSTFYGCDHTNFNNVNKVDIQTPTELFGFDVKDSFYAQYEEGTVLKLWYMGDTNEIDVIPCLYGTGWMISTSHKIYGYRASLYYKAKDTIGDIITTHFSEYFEDLISKFVIDSDKEKCFIFLLKTPDNTFFQRQSNKFELIYMGYFSNDTDNNSDTDSFLSQAISNIGNYFLSSSENTVSTQESVSVSSYQVFQKAEKNHIPTLIINNHKHKNIRALQYEKVRCISDIKMPENTNECGIVFYDKRGSYLRVFFSEYSKLLSIKSSDTFDWKKWWWCCSIQDKNNDEMLNKILPESQYQLIKEWEEDLKIKENKSKMKIYDEYINRLIHIHQPIHHHKMSRNEEIVIKETKNKYKRDKEIFFSEEANLKTHFYWGGNPENVNHHIKSVIFDFWDKQSKCNQYSMMNLV
jgi:hypothetical protein